MESVARFILVFQLMSSVRGKLQWEVLERVTNFGQTVKLICLSDACKNTEDCQIRTGWDRHIPDPTITFAVTTDQKNIPATNKYSGHFVQNGFTLEIRNLSKEDLDIKYECSAGFNRSEAKHLLEEDVFKGCLHWEVLEQIEEYGQTLKLICISESCNNNSCPWKPVWARNASGFEILLDDVRNQLEVKNGKYSGRIVEKGFTLEIRNLSTTDLELSYQCSLPFNKSNSHVLLSSNIIFEKSFDEVKDNTWIIGGSIISVIVVALVFVAVFVVYKTRGRSQYSAASGTDLNGTDVQLEDTDLNGADVQFQGILSNQVLTNISTRINHWELLQIALHLGFEGSKISEYQNLGDVCEQGLELFKEFISTNRCAKTDANIVAQLRKALIEVNRKDIADNFLPTD